MQANGGMLWPSFLPENAFFQTDLQSEGLTVYYEGEVNPFKSACKGANMFGKRAGLLFVLCASMCLAQSVWESENSGVTNDLVSVTYGNGRFAALTNFIGWFPWGGEYDSSTVLTSSNGAAWNTSAHIIGLSSLTYGKGQFVAVGAGTILTSPDAAAWTAAYLDTTGGYDNGSGFKSAVYGNGSFVTVGSQGIIMTSADGTTWTKRLSGTTRTLSSVTYGSGRFLAVSSDLGNETSVVLTSSDAVTWTIADTAIVALNSVTYGDGLFLATVNSQETELPAVFTSADGSMWTTNCLSSSSYILSITYGNGQFVGAGYYAPGIFKTFPTILNSPDAVTWTTRFLDTTNQVSTYNQLNSVAYGNGLFVAVGYGGMILTSQADIGVIQTGSNRPSVGNFKININKTNITVSLPTVLSGRAFTIGIFAIDGKKIYSSHHQAYNGILNIPVSGLPTGTYLMSIRGSNTALSSSFVVTK